MPDQAGDMRYAHETGVHTIYKFRAFRTAKERENVEDIVLGHRVYFARASQLDDPDDLRPLVRIRRRGSEQETRAALLADAMRIFQASPDELSIEEIERRLDHLRSVSLDELEARGVELARARLERDHPIFCASSRRDLVKLWEDYADKRTGVCIHICSDSSSPFGLAQAVRYTNERATLVVPIEDAHQAADAALLTKAKRWADQFEYRLVTYPDVPYEEIGLRFDGQKASFPGRLITGIGVGVDMDDENLRRVVALARRHDPPLKVFRPRGPIRTEPLDSGTA